MNKNEIWSGIDSELRRAKKAFPTWPDHIVARAGIVVEEAGELMQAALQSKYQPTKKSRKEHIEAMKAEAIQTAAMAIRFLENLKDDDK
jgi:NTP pyrophosphatase (non-canonical NTP hydrolase)